ncbi:flavodoxin family protein [Desulfovibrionales bacterium]
MTHPLILSLSPRAGGNSDTAAAWFAAALASTPAVRYLRDFSVLPCLGCGACSSTGQCVRAAQDQTEELFTALDQAPALVLTGPVYFYHLPAQAKAWIDRSQSRYMRRQISPPLAQAQRPAVLVLVAGRPQGAKLCTGITRTLRYFLDIFGFTLEETLCLRGLDERTALQTSSASLAAITALAQSRSW